MERNPNRFSEKDCRIACCYDPNCMVTKLTKTYSSHGLYTDRLRPFAPQVWQAYPLSKGRQCFHGYKSANVSCTHDNGKNSGLGGGTALEPIDLLIIHTNVASFVLLGGMRRVSPEPAFRTDYSFAGLLMTVLACGETMVVMTVSA